MCIFLTEQTNEMLPVPEKLNTSLPSDYIKFLSIVLLSVAFLSPHKFSKGRKHSTMTAWFFPVSEWWQLQKYSKCSKEVGFTFWTGLNIGTPPAIRPALPVFVTTKDSSRCLSCTTCTLYSLPSLLPHKVTGQLTELLSPPSQTDCWSFPQFLFVRHRCVVLQRISSEGKYRQ